MPDKIWKLYDGSTGVTCSKFNSGAVLPWKTEGGDFAPEIAAEKKLGAGYTGVVQMDVTSLLGADFIMVRSGSGVAVISARESGNGPRLRVRRANGVEVVLQATADAIINCSSTNALGGSSSISIGNGNAAIAFAPAPPDAVSAVLELNVTTVYSSGALLRAHRGLTPRSPVLPVEHGISARYPGDVGIEKDPDVLWADNFDSDDWWKKWLLKTDESASSDCTRVTSNPLLGFIADSGRALQVFMAGQVYGSGCGITGQLKSLLGGEQEEFRFRYRLRFGKDFRDPTLVDGGKLPGMASQYYDQYTPICGNGGIPSDGLCGWSMRGGFSMLADKNNPAYPRVKLHTYAYDGDMVTINPDGTRTIHQYYGHYWSWAKGGGLMELDRWYSVEQYVKVNTPGVADGILRVWIDGQLAFEKTNIYLRGVPPYHDLVGAGTLGVRQLWLSIFYGGKNPPGKDMTLWIDNFVIGRRYIGPYVPLSGP